MTLSFKLEAFMTPEPPLAHAAALLHDLAPLGAARVLLRNCSGFVELFCDVEDIILTPGWLHLGVTEARLHLQLPVLRAASLHEAGTVAHPHPSLWLYGRCGSPCLVVVFDQMEGAAREQQAARFRALRERYGTRVEFDVPDDVGS